MKCLSLFTRCALAAALCLTAHAASAQDYPKKPVRLVVGMAPGGANDTVARMIGAELSKTMPQPVIVENRPGANSTIATGELKRAPADGYTLMIVISSHVTNTFLYPGLTYSLGDFAPVSLLAETPFVLVANPKFAPNNVRELIASAKAGKIDFGTPGSGSTQHISMELMNQMAGIEMTQIPYKGGAPAQQDLLAGQIPLIFATPTQSLPFIKDRKLKPLAVTSMRRLDLLPDVPTVAEAGIPGYEANVWFGIIAPAGTPAPVVSYLNTEISKIMKKPEFQKRLSDLGLASIDGSPAQFQKLIDQEKVKWAEVIKKSNLKIE
jgi:tripartite-type tricarboxylate transporter receptor subunit TctC